MLEGGCGPPRASAFVIETGRKMSLALTD